MITIPKQSDKKWIQTNSGDVFGNLYSTKNVQFNREGYLSLSKKTRALYREAASGADFDQVLAIVFSPIGDMVVTSDDIFDFTASSVSSTPLVKNTDSGVPTPTLNGDAVVFNNLIYVTGNTATNFWDSSIWTSASIALTSGVPHPMCVFESFNYLAIATSANIVKLYDTSNTLIETLTIPDDNEIQWMVYKDSNLYIGTRSLVGGTGRMYVWDGSGSAAQKSYPAKGEALMSGCVYSSSIATISSSGQILLFNGGGFTEIGALPVYYSDLKWTDTSNRVARRGMITDGELLYINIEGQVYFENTPIYLSSQPSGLWCYDPKVGTYHTGSLSSDYATYATISSVDNGTQVITIGTAVETQTGEPVFYDGDVSTYYAIRLSSTTFQLAANYEDAIAGNEITLSTISGMPSGVIAFPKGGDFGATFNAAYSAGAVAIVPESRSYVNFFINRIVYGGWRVAEDAVGTTYATLQSFTLGENRGNFVTQKVFSNNIEDVWNKIILKAKHLFSQNDKIVVKYRLNERQYYPIIPFSFQINSYNITWISTASFTVTDTKWTNVQAGDEVEIIAGAGAGFTAHITTISENAGTYTVVIDETIPLVTVSDTSQVVVDNWTKGATITSSRISLHETTPVNLASKWIQIKCELRGREVQVEEIQLVNKTQIPTQ